jgi:hypothetical protein
VTPLDRIAWRLAYAALVAGLFAATILATADGALLAFRLGAPYPVQLLVAAIVGVLPRAVVIARWSSRGRP